MKSFITSDVLDIVDPTMKDVDVYYFARGKIDNSHAVLIKEMIDIDTPVIVYNLDGIEFSLVYDVMDGVYFHSNQPIIFTEIIEILGI